MNIIHILTHDVYMHIANYLTIDNIVNLEMCSKQMPDLLNRLCVMELSGTVQNNKKIISFIHNHKLIDHTSKDDPNIISKIIYATLNKNDSYLYYSIFVVSPKKVSFGYAYNICKKYGKEIQFRDSCKIIFDICASCELNLPWLTIPLILNEKYCVQTILNFCDSSNMPYNFSKTPIVDVCIGTYEIPYIYDYIVSLYPEFKPILDSIENKK